MESKSSQRSDTVYAQLGQGKKRLRTLCLKADALQPLKAGVKFLYICIHIQKKNKSEKFNEAESAKDASPKRKLIYLQL